MQHHDRNQAVEAARAYLAALRRRRAWFPVGRFNDEMNTVILRHIETEFAKRRRELGRQLDERGGPIKDGRRTYRIEFESGEITFSTRPRRQKQNRGGTEEVTC